MCPSKAESRPCADIDMAASVKSIGGSVDSGYMTSCNSLGCVRGVLTGTNGVVLAGVGCALAEPECVEAGEGATVDELAEDGLEA